MWTCNNCKRSFSKTNQVHYCGDSSIAPFLLGKTEVSLALFDHLIAKFKEIGPIHLRATKSMIIIANDKGFAYIINIGKNFIDVVLPFKEIYKENLCFRKMVMVPGGKDYNHHLRLLMPEDMNEEVFDYLKKAYANGKNL